MQRKQELKLNQVRLDKQLFYDGIMQMLNEREKILKSSERGAGEVIVTALRLETRRVLGRV